jgi:hypothetical protein
MMKVGYAMLAVPLAALAALVGAPVASADERACRGTLGAITVDNLRVPQGATCVLNGTKAKGTIKVERKATLHATNVRVVGNVQAENHKHVGVRTSRIGGSIQVVQGGSSTVVGNKVTADIQYFENRGAIVVSKNRVNGNLQCKENSKKPTGGGNKVGGNKEDQCKRL